MGISSGQQLIESKLNWPIFSFFSCFCIFYISERSIISSQCMVNYCWHDHYLGVKCSYMGSLLTLGDRLFPEKCLLNEIPMVITSNHPPLVMAWAVLLTYINIAINITILINIIQYHHSHQHHNYHHHHHDQRHHYHYQCHRHHLKPLPHFW